MRLKPNNEHSGSNNPKEVQRPTLTLFCGLPGAGKTTLAKELEENGVGIRICTDEWQVNLGIEANDEAFHERLQPVLYQFALKLLAQGVSVILEDGLWTRKERLEKFNDAQLVGAKIVWHIFDLSLEELKHRNRTRNRNASYRGPKINEKTLEKYFKLFERPQQDELSVVDEVIFHRVNTSPTL